MIANARFLKAGVLLVLIGLAGCSKKKKADQLDPSEERLLKIGRAYVQACHRLQRAPKNVEEIKPDIAGGFTDDLLRSENDGEPFVILWGVDYTQLPSQPNDPFTVGGYEKHGIGGKRYVLRFPIGAVRMTDDELKKAVFPPGHQPPS